jgi:hypothetical protein
MQIVSGRLLPKAATAKGRKTTQVTLQMIQSEQLQLVAKEAEQVMVEPMKGKRSLVKKSSVPSFSLLVP